MLPAEGLGLILVQESKSHKVGGAAKKKDTNVITIDKYILLITLYFANKFCGFLFVCFFLNLLQVLVIDGLRTGVTEWPEPLEAKSAVELVQEFLNGVCFPSDSHLAFVYFS